jgi:hypothetical protein
MNESIKIWILGKCYDIYNNYNFVIPKFMCEYIGGLRCIDYLQNPIFHKTSNGRYAIKGISEDLLSFEDIPAGVKKKLTVWECM